MNNNDSYSTELIPYLFYPYSLLLLCHQKYQCQNGLLSALDLDYINGDMNMAIFYTYRDNLKRKVDKSTNYIITHKTQNKRYNNTALIWYAK